MAKTKIGGQALIEGVMMRSATGVAMAVREPHGNIILETEKLPEPKTVNKIPFVRGVFNFVASIKGGMVYTMKAAAINADDEEERITDSEMKKAGIFGIFFGVILALVLFMLLPDFLTRIVFNLCGGAVSGSNFGEVWKSLTSNSLIESSGGMLFWGNLVKGVIKIAIFVVYLLSITRMKEIKRLFMYHGSEHKTINCFEKEMPLTVENVQKCSTYHDRCGTAFIFFVILVSILVTSLVEILLRSLFVSIESQGLKTFLRMIVKILCLIPVSSISYELLMFNSRHDWWILKPLKWLGRSMQLLTTRQPDDDMVEVAIVAFNKALEMQNDPAIPAQRFTRVSEFTKAARKALVRRGLDETSADWLIADVLKVQRSQLDSDEDYIGYQDYDLLMKKLVRLLEGNPVQYELGTQQFFDYEFKVNPSVLIPRPETELLTEKVIACASGKTVLDLCAGSGCIGITVALKTGADVTLSDISEEALAVAEENAKLLGANVSFIKSDMFEKIDGSYDIIVSNPPYISEEDMKKLDEWVKKEPEIALFGGKDGLDYYRIIAREAKSHLNGNGLLFLEVGAGQAESVSAMLEENGFTVTVAKDYAGIDRMICAEIKNKAETEDKAEAKE